MKKKLYDYKKISLQDLIKMAKNDDNLAISEIVARYKDKVYESICLLNPTDDVFDLTQEALLRLSRSVKKLKKPEKFDAWLNQIVKNLFYDTLRKKKNINASIATDFDMNESVFGDCIIDKSKTPDENSLYCELKTKINIAISKLPALFRTIVLLREIEGLSYDEIADITDLNVGTVKSRLARARIILKNELEPYIK